MEFMDGVTVKPMITGRPLDNEKLLVLANLGGELRYG
jgi:hypothetical protein